MSEETDRSLQLLNELAEEGRCNSHRSSPHRAWVEKYFKQLYNLVEQQQQSFDRISERVASDMKISPTTLRKHYKAVKKQKRAEERERKSAEANGNGSNGRRRESKRRPIDPSTVKPPPPLVHAEVIEE